MAQRLPDLTIDGVTGLTFATTSSQRRAEAVPTGVLYTLDGHGGPEEDMVELARRLEPGRFRLVFATLTDEAAEVGEKLRRGGADVRHCPLGRAFPAAFHRLLRELRPRVVQSRSAPYAPLPLSVARLSGIPRRVTQLSAPRLPAPTARDSRYPSSRRPRRGTGHLVLDAWATDLVGASEAVMRQVWGEEWRLDPRCRLIYPGVEIEPLGVAIAARRRTLDVDESGEPAPVGIVHTTAPESAEGRARAVEVLNALRGRGVDARLQLVGRVDPDQERLLRAQAARGGAAANLKLADAATGRRTRDRQVSPLSQRPYRGARGPLPLRTQRPGGRNAVPPDAGAHGSADSNSDLVKLLAAASMLLFTASDCGDLPRPVLQACALGTPVLTADLPVIREVARLLPGITMLPLGADDEIWADTARVLTAVPPSLDERREALRVFVHSPFTADSWQREVTALWS